jgi:hypothetical protein
MPQLALEFHPLAADEAQAAEQWYRRKERDRSWSFPARTGSSDRTHIRTEIDLVAEREDHRKSYEGHYAKPKR